MKTVDAPSLKSMINDGAELALLDVREDGQFGEGHLLFANPLPYSVLESRVDARVPRRGTRIVLVDAGDGVAENAAARLDACGYTDIAMLDGGTTAWADAGYEIFKDVNVPCKAFGEVGLTADLLRDADRSVALAYWAAESADQERATRVSALVGPDGKVLKTYEVSEAEAHTSDALADIP